MGEAIAWGMQPGNVPKAVREQVAPFLGDTTPSLHSELSVAHSALAGRAQLVGIRQQATSLFCGFRP